MAATDPEPASTAPPPDSPSAAAPLVPGQPGWLAAMPPEYVARTAPPTVAGPLGGVARKPRWPGAVGSISVALGVLGLLMGAVTIVSQLISGSFASAIPGQADIFAAQRKWIRETIITQSISLLISALLLAAGVALLRRSPRTRLLFFAWVPLRSIGGVAVSLVTYLMQIDQFAAMTAMSMPGGAAQAAAMGAISEITVVATAVGYAIWALLWPTFILIWLNRPVIRAQMREWNPLPGTPATAARGA